MMVCFTCSEAAARARLSRWWRGEDAVWRCACLGWRGCCCDGLGPLEGGVHSRRVYYFYFCKQAKYNVYSMYNICLYVLILW
jgi:hypothetical protein